MTSPNRLLNKNFFLLWQGQLVSQMGNQVHYIALMYWIKHATGSASLMGLIMMLSMLPGIILGPVGGTIADNFSRRRIIIFSDVLCGIGVLSLAGMLFYAPGHVSTIVVWLFVVSIFVGIVGSFFRPAISASIPDLVPREKIAAANSMNQSSYQIALFIGQGIGGVLFRVLGAAMLFLADGLTYLFSALSESFIKIPQKIPEKSKGFRPVMRQFARDTGEGFRYVWKSKGLRDLVFAASFLNFFSAPFAVLMPFYVEDFLHASPDWFGFILAAIGVGSLVGYVVVGAVKVSGRVRSILIISCLFGVGLVIAAFAVVRTPIVAVGLCLVTGFMSGVINVYLATILQITTPGEIRGRVFGLLNTIAAGLMPVGMGLAGVVAELTGNNIPVIFGVCGIMTSVLTVLVSVGRDFREFLAYEEKHEIEN